MDNDTLYNDDVKGWGTGTLNDIKTKAKELDIKHRKGSPSPNSSVQLLKVRFAMIDGKIKRIAYNLRRTLIYVHKGVGKDTPISKVGTTNRKEKDFFNDPVDHNIEKLADIVAEHSGDTISNNILIQ